MIDDHVKISLDEQLNIRAAGTYLVKVEGDSMQGVGIYSGDILIVDKAIEGPDVARMNVRFPSPTQHRCLADALMAWLTCGGCGPWHWTRFARWTGSKVHSGWDYGPEVGGRYYAVLGFH